MADKNIQMTQRNSANTGWDNLNPITTAANVLTTDGKTLEDFKNTKSRPGGLATLDGTGKILAAQVPILGGIKVFKEPGNFTWTVPANINTVYISGAGGGGSGVTANAGGVTSFGDKLSLGGGGGVNSSFFPGEGGTTSMGYNGMPGGWGVTAYTGGPGGGSYGPGGTTYRNYNNIGKPRDGIAGGGGGGKQDSNINNGSGGGGGGAFTYNYPISVTPGETINITIGKGGYNSSSDGGKGGDGLLIIQW